MSFYDYDFPNASNYKNDLSCLIRYYKELLAQYKIILADVKELQVSYDTIDDKIEMAISKEIEEAVLTLEMQISVINNRIAILDSRMIGFNNQVNERIDSVIVQFNKQMNESNLELLAKIANNRIEMLEITQRLQEEIENINLNLAPIFNPIQGIDTSIEQAVLDVYNALNFGAITAEEYDNLKLTASAYDELQISAIIYDTKARNNLL